MNRSVDWQDEDEDEDEDDDGDDDHDHDDDKGHLTTLSHSTNDAQIDRAMFEVRSCHPTWISLWISVASSNRTSIPSSMAC